MNGIIVIDKPQGMTSHDVVSVLRRKTGVKRIGHSGTLDPMATGVLPVFIGKATRVIEYAGDPFDQEAKHYRCEMKLGIETDTQDIWGKELVCDENAIIPCISEVTDVLKSFEGESTQRPPMYSAIKVKGRKLYEYARKGTSVDEGLIKERKIYIKHINVIGFDPESGEVSFDVFCSKGVYIRTICADAGRILGCGAVMSGLRRLKSDGFSIDLAVSLDEVIHGDMPALMPLDTPLGWMKKEETDDESAKALAQGKVIDAKNKGDGPVRVYSADSFIGIGKYTDDHKIKPEKVLIRL